MVGSQNYKRVNVCRHHALAVMMTGMMVFAMIQTSSAFSSILSVSATGNHHRQQSVKTRTSPCFMASEAADDADVVRIGMFGGGTVGGGIVELLTQKQDLFYAMTSKRLEVVKLCVRDASKPRDFALPESCEVVTNYDDILNDASVDMVVEVMGGTDDAKHVVYESLKKGKHVVTANKALIAKHLSEIESVLQDINRDRETPVEFRYEAAVCGGIPIIRSLQSDFVGDDITMISGIINGCTNFMLTSMDRYAKSYADALKEASELGYAEADPTLDVGGFDARSKLRILLRLAYGIEVEEDEISCKGITELTKLDFEYAKMMGGTIKLLGVSKRLEGNKIAAFVSPCFVSESDSLASVSGATNAVEVISNNLISSIYIGQGAGRFPTANSCLNDILAVARGDSSAAAPFGVPIEKNALSFVNNYDSVFFIRLKYRDGLGITRQCGEICERHGVSIHSMLQNPVLKTDDDAAFVIITEKVPLANILKVCAEVEALDWCRGPAFFMPVLRENWTK